MPSSIVVSARVGAYVALSRAPGTTATKAPRRATRARGRRPAVGSSAPAPHGP
jgi:hypothetical protein